MYRCNGGSHMYCLSPPLTHKPPGYWYCSACLSPRPNLPRVCKFRAKNKKNTSSGGDAQSRGAAPENASSTTCGIGSLEEGGVSRSRGGAVTEAGRGARGSAEAPAPKRMRGAKRMEQAFKEDGFQEAGGSVCAVGGGGADGGAGGALHAQRPYEYRVGDYVEVLYAGGNIWKPGRVTKVERYTGNRGLCVHLEYDFKMLGRSVINTHPSLEKEGERVRPCLDFDWCKDLESKNKLETLKVGDSVEARWKHACVCCTYADVCVCVC
jgi:hypothetical protein